MHELVNTKFIRLVNNALKVEITPAVAVFRQDAMQIKKRCHPQ